MRIKSNSKHGKNIYYSLINNNKHNKISLRTKKTICIYFIKILFIYLAVNEILFLKKINNSIKMKIKNLINKLKRNSIYRHPKYLIFFDFYENPFCNDINAYLLFKHYIKINETNAVYVINNSSELYNSLLKKNKTKNLIPVYDQSGFYNVIYPYLLNSKIIVNSYLYVDIQEIVNHVNYLKYLFITHAIGYFKTKIISPQFASLKESKRNIINYFFTF